MLGAQQQNLTVNRVMSLVQLVRLARLRDLLRMLYVDTMTGSGHQGMTRYMPITATFALIILYTVAVLINLLTCLAWLVASLEGLDNSWVTSKEWSWNNAKAFQDNIPAQYLVSFYWVFTTVVHRITTWEPVERGPWH